MDHNDQSLWARARSGDADAFGTLFERHMQAVYRFCFWRTADSALAEDLTSAVFLETWRKRARHELHAETMLRWLLGVASNLLRNQQRSARRREAALKRLPPITPESDFAEDASARPRGRAGCRGSA
jgi:RNA polymerase sigma factor (sigma-70 family)